MADFRLKAEKLIGKMNKAIRSDFISKRIISGREEYMLIMDEEDTVIDAGCFRGETLKYFSSHARHVIGFEPSMESYKEASKEAEKSSNIFLFNIALGDFDGTAELGVHENRADDSFASDGIRSEPAIMAKLDSFLDGFYGKDMPNITLMKISTNGYEDRVLAGAEKTIRRFRPKLIIEYRNNLDEVKKRLKGYYIKEVRSLGEGSGILLCMNKTG